MKYSHMTKAVAVVVVLALTIGGLMTLRDQLSSVTARAAVAACGGIAIAVAMIVLRRR